MKASLTLTPCEGLSLAKNTLSTKESQYSNVLLHLPAPMSMLLLLLKKNVNVVVPISYMVVSCFLSMGRLTSLPP